MLGPGWNVVGLAVLFALTATTMFFLYTFLGWNGHGGL